MPFRIDNNGKSDIILPSGGSYNLSIEQNDELITNLVDRNFSGACNWIGTGWVRNADETLRHVTTTDIAIGELTSNWMTAYKITKNHRYQITFSISTYTAGTVTPAMGNVTGKAVSGTGTWTQIIKAPDDNVSLILIPTGLNAYIDNVSLKEIVDVIAMDSTGAYSSNAGFVSGRGVPAGFMGKTSGILPLKPPHGTIAFDALDSSAMKVFDRQQGGWYPNTKFGGNTSLTRGLLCCLNMEEDAANTAVVDATGRVTTAVASTNTSNLHASGAGVSASLGDYFDFDAAGAGEYINLVGLEPTLGQYIDYGKPFSVSMWINPDTVVPGNCLLFGNNLQSSPNIALCAMSARIGIQWQYSGAVYQIYWTGNVLTVGTWTHVVWVYNGGSNVGYNTGTNKVYTDGTVRAVATLAASNQVVTSCNSGQNFSLGRAILDVGGAYDYDGKMDQVCVWNRELTAAEVALLYGGGSGLAYSADSLYTDLLCRLDMADDAATTNVVDSLGLITATASTNTSNLHASGAGVANLGDYFKFRGAADNDGIELVDIEPVVGDYLARGKPWSVSFWLKATSSATVETLIGTSVVAAGPGIGIVKYSGTKEIAILWTAVAVTNYRIYCNQAHVIDENVWHMVTVTYNGNANIEFDSGNVKIYIDAISSALTSTSVQGADMLTPCVQDKWSIGKFIEDSTYDSTSYMDQVCIWKREITQAEITRLYNSGNGYSF